MRPGERGAESWEGLDLAAAAALEADAVLSRLGSSPSGIAAEEATRRLGLVGPNAVLGHQARPLQVLARQLRNPLLILLAAAAVVSMLVGERAGALIILVIVFLSVGLGFVNEYRSEKAVAALHSSIRHTAVTERGGHQSAVDVTHLVPGDVVHLDVGEVVPADLRLLEANALEADEAVLTGESFPALKTAKPITGSTSALDLACCVFMGTVVRAGTGRGVVVGTGARTAFGRIARGLQARPPETAFQQGLRDFSRLLLRVTAVLTISIFAVNAILRRPLLEAALFALAVAVGLTPQLLPAIVTVSLSTGARRLVRKKVVVKRLVSIEDMGNIDVLFTDKTGTLTEGRIAFQQSLGPDGAPRPEVLLLGLLCNSVVVEDGAPVGGNPLDRALWESPGAAGASLDRLSAAGRGPLRLRPPGHVGAGGGTGRPPADHQGGPGSGARALRAGRRRGRSRPRGALRRGGAGGCRRHQGERGRCRRPRRRAGPAPRRLPDLLRPAQGGRRRVPRPPRHAGHHREGGDRRQRPRGPEGVHRSRHGGGGEPGRQRPSPG